MVDTNVKQTFSFFHLKAATAIAILLFMQTSCGVYSFTGASLSPELKTIQITYFSNRATLAQPTVSQVFTDKLKDKFLSQTSLSPVNEGGDLLFEGYISDYNTMPTAIQSSDQAALNRLTISVVVKFINKKDEKQNFETTFSRYADYSATRDLASVESGLINDISSQLVDDIFNRAVINW